MTNYGRRGGPSTSDDAGRNENYAERLDRNLDELLQELRVASIGVQVLFGFLLSIPFTTAFASLDDTHRALYTADLVLAALATALLIAPVARHRLLFRRHAKDRVLRFANRCAIAGLDAVALAISASVLLVTSLVWSGVIGVLISVPTAATVLTLWFVRPRKHASADY